MLILNISTVIIFAFAVFFASAIFYGRIEKFIFGNCDLRIGEPDFLKFFKKAYHVPLAILVTLEAFTLDTFLTLAIGRTPGLVLFLPTWALLEDISYFTRNPYHQLDTRDWITATLGGITVFGRFIPFVYIGLGLYSALIIWWRIL